jgi:MFS family permease
MPSHSTRFTLAFACVAHSFSHLAMLLYATAVLALEVEFGLPFADLAWLSLPGFVLFGVAALPAGWLADRWNASAMMTIYFLGVGGALILTGFADGSAGLLVGLSAIGLFAAIYHPVGIPWLVKNAANPGRALGINGVFGSLGTAAAGIIAGALADLVSWRLAFIVPGAVCVLVGLAFIAAGRRGLIVDAATDVRPSAPPAAGEARRVFAILAVTVLCTGLIYQGTSVGLPKLFAERLPELTGGSALGAGLFVSLVYLASAASQVVGGELADRFRPRNVYLLCQALQVPVLALAFFSHNPAFVAAAALMVSLNVAGQPAENVLVASYTPLAWRGRVFGAKFVITLGVSALGVSLVPAIHGLTGSLDGLLLSFVAIAAIATGAALLLPRARALVPTPDAAE